MMKDKINVNNVVNIMINPNNFVRKTLGIPASGNQYAALNKLIDVTGKAISDSVKWINTNIPEAYEKFTNTIKSELVNSKLIENEFDEKEIELKSLIPVIEVLVRNELSELFNNCHIQSSYVLHENQSELKNILSYIRKCGLFPDPENGRSDLRNTIKKAITARKIFDNDKDIQETTVNVLTEIYLIHIKCILKDIELNKILDEGNKKSNSKQVLGVNVSNLRDSILEGVNNLNEESSTPVEKLIPVEKEKKNQKETDEELKQQVQEMDEYTNDMEYLNKTSQQKDTEEVEMVEIIDVDGSVLEAPVYEENTENSTETHVEIPEAFNILFKEATGNEQDDYDYTDESQMLYDTLSKREKEKQLEEIDKYTKDLKKMNEVSQKKEEKTQKEEPDKEDIPNDIDEIDKELEVLKKINSGKYNNPLPELPIDKIDNKHNCVCSQVPITGDTSYDDEYETRWLEDASNTDLKLIDNAKLMFLSMAMLINGLDCKSINGVTLDEINTKEIASKFTKDALFVSDKCNKLQYAVNSMEFNARFVTNFLLKNDIDSVIRYYVINHEKEEKKYIKGIRYATDWLLDGIISMLSKTKTGFDFRLRHGIKDSVKGKKVQVGSMGTSNAILCHSKIFELSEYDSVKEHDQFKQTLTTGYDAFNDKERKLSTGETMIYLVRMAYIAVTGQFNFPTDDDWLTDKNGSMKDKHYCRKIICELGEAIGVMGRKYHIEMSDMYRAFSKAQPNLSKYTKASKYIPDEESKKDYIRGVKALLFTGYIEQDSTIQNLVEKVCI